MYSSVLLLRSLKCDNDLSEEIVYGVFVTLLIFIKIQPNLLIDKNLLRHGT